MASSTRERRPTWELTDLLLPYQGDWTVEEYLKLHTNRLIEFTDGYLDFLPMPDEIHWEVQNFVFSAVKAFLAKRGAGVVRYAPFKVRVGPKAFREPDVCILLNEQDPRRAREYWGGADVAMEVVSRDKPERDYEEKREDYAAAGISEYWIIDPQVQTLTILVLAAGTYREHAVLTAGRAVSTVAEGFSIDVGECFAAMNLAAPNAKPLEDGTD